MLFSFLNNICRNNEGESYDSVVIRIDCYNDDNNNAYIDNNCMFVISFAYYSNMTYKSQYSNYQCGLTARLKENFVAQMKGGEIREIIMGIKII